MHPKYSLAEIERRWLVEPSQAKELLNAAAREIEDKYVVGGRLRLQKVTAPSTVPVFKLGKKYPRIGAEPESVVSIYLSEGEYETLIALPGSVARKIRYSVAGGSLDVYDYPNPGLVVFEVEFESESASAQYTPPSFVGQEVTRNAKFSGYAIANTAL